jgi:hypothetical protein
MTKRSALWLVILVAASMPLVAASDADADATPAPVAKVTPEPVAVTPDPAGGEEEDSGAAPAPGTALLTVDDESYSFEITSCFFPPDDDGKHTTSFSLTATGTVDGAQAEMGAIVKDSFEKGRLEGNGVSHWVTLDDVEDLENPALLWLARSGYFANDPSWTVNVDDKHISAEPVFDDGRTEASETIGGTFEAICP